MKDLSSEDLAAWAKRTREDSGKSRAQAAREMGVSQTSIFNAEETPGESLVKLRIRMIESYSDRKVKGPFFHIEKA